MGRVTTGSDSTDVTNSGLDVQSEASSGSDEKQRVFLTWLEEAVTNGGTKSLWKKYGNRITMQFKDRNLEAKVVLYLLPRLCLIMHTCCINSQFVQEPFEQVHYFCVGLLCLLLLFYLTQTIILPVTRVSVHVCFTICTLVVTLGTVISLSDKLYSKGLASPTILILSKQIKYRRFLRYSFFLLLWFLAFFCSHIGLVIINFWTMY